jgi:hypothetical protein
MSITINGTTGIIADSPATVKANAFLDASGGNTATINGAVPAPLASPALTGIPTAPTAALGTNTTQLATTAFALANAVGAVNIQVFTTTGTYTPTAGYTWGIAFVTGGGGGGTTGTGATAGGGGAGATAIGVLNLTTLGAVTATVGTAGSGTNVAGVNSTLSTLTGGGGLGGGSVNAGTGGTATGGVINIRGGDSAGNGAPSGGGSFWGSGGHIARPYGAGGSNGNGGSQAGVAGVIMIMEFK